jgi:hypothetical protein
MAPNLKAVSQLEEAELAQWLEPEAKPRVKPQKSEMVSKAVAPLAGANTPREEAMTVSR